MCVITRETANGRLADEGAPAGRLGIITVKSAWRAGEKEDRERKRREKEGHDKREVDEKVRER